MRGSPRPSADGRTTRGTPRRRFPRRSVEARLVSGIVGSAPAIAAEDTPENQDDDHDDRDPDDPPGGRGLDREPDVLAGVRLIAGRRQGDDVITGQGVGARGELRRDHLLLVGAEVDRIGWAEVDLPALWWAGAQLHARDGRSAGVVEDEVELGPRTRWSVAVQAAVLGREGELVVTDDLDLERLLDLLPGDVGDAAGAALPR